MPCTSGGVCPGEADRLTVPSRAKFPSGTKICCSCPVYTNNLLSGARTCPSATFYHLTEESIHSVKHSPQALAITKQPDSVCAWKYLMTTHLFSINSQRNDQRGRGESKNVNYLLSGFPVRLGAPKSPPLPIAARTPCYPPGPLLSVSERSSALTDGEHWHRRQPCLCINYVKGRIPRWERYSIYLDEVY